MSAASLIDEATAAGVPLRVEPDGSVKVLARPSEVPPDLLAALRAHKTAVPALLMGDICRWCGDRMGWPSPVGIILGDGTALHHRCSEAFHFERVRRLARNAHSPDGMADKAEVMIHGRII